MRYKEIQEIKYVWLWIGLVVIFALLHSNYAQAQNSLLQKNAPAKTVFAFLNWYKNNKSALDQINVINNYLSEDSSKPYSINFQKTEQYISLVQKSKCVSAEYLNNWREYFRKCDKQFTKLHIFEGPAEGLEFDYVMLVQDYGNDLNELNRAKVVKTQTINNTAYVTVEFLYKDKYLYKLTKNSNQWLIDGIKLISSASIEGNAVHPFTIK